MKSMLRNDKNGDNRGEKQGVDGLLRNDKGDDNRGVKQGVDGLLRNDKGGDNRGVKQGVDGLLRNDKGGDNRGMNRGYTLCRFGSRRFCHCEATRPRQKVQTRHGFTSGVDRLLRNDKGGDNRGVKLDGLN